MESSTHATTSGVAISTPAASSTLPAAAHSAPAAANGAPLSGPGQLLEGFGQSGPKMLGRGDLMNTNKNFGYGSAWASSAVAARCQPRRAP
jgi:hypothetical protein